MVSQLNGSVRRDKSVLGIIKVDNLNIWEIFCIPRHDSSFYNLIFSVNFLETVWRQKVWGWQKELKRLSIFAFCFPGVLFVAAWFIFLHSNRLQNVHSCCRDGWFTQKSPKYKSKVAQKTWFHTKCLDKRWYFIFHRFESLFTGLDPNLGSVPLWFEYIFEYVHFSILHMWTTKFIVLWDDFMDKFVITRWRDWAGTLM